MTALDIMFHWSEYIYLIYNSGQELMARKVIGIQREQIILVSFSGYLTKLPSKYLPFYLYINTLLRHHWKAFSLQRSGLNTETIGLCLVVNWIFISHFLLLIFRNWYGEIIRTRGQRCDAIQSPDVFYL